MQDAIRVEPARKTALEFRSGDANNGKADRNPPR